MFYGAYNHVTFLTKLQHIFKEELVLSTLVKIGPNSLKRMPATIHGLRRMPAPWYHPIASWFGYIFMISVFFNLFVTTATVLPKFLKFWAPPHDFALF